MQRLVALLAGGRALSGPPTAWVQAAGSPATAIHPRKVGQLIQADIASITPDDLRHFSLGSILNGGNSSPGNDEFAAPSEWLALADRFYDVSVDPSNGRAPVPTMWGTDAVHGHNNVVGATIFPHDIGLGAARGPDLIRQIAEVTTINAGLDILMAPDSWRQLFIDTIAQARAARIRP